MKKINEENIIEKRAPALSGMAMLIALILGEIITLLLFVYSTYLLSISGFIYLYLIVVIISSLFFYDIHSY